MKNHMMARNKTNEKILRKKKSTGYTYVLFQVKLRARLIKALTKLKLK